MEIEQNWNGKFSGEKIGGLCGGNGMEFFLTKQVETNFDVMEWKWNGVEKEKFEIFDIMDILLKK